jgi:transcriptional regulator with XRE-family HTH domain
MPALPDATYSPPEPGPDRAPPDATDAAPGAGPEPHGGSFGALLRQYRVARAVSQAALAARAGMDRSYINRLEAGERGAPGLAAVEALARALALSDEQADRLFAAAGLLPRSLRALGPADPTLLLVARRLADPRLSPASRAALRTAIELIAGHWGETEQGQG